MKNAAPTTRSINTAAMIAGVLPVPDDDVPAATTLEGDDDGVGDAETFTVFDTRGDGFTEVVGVGDTGTTVGLAVTVAVGFGRV
jgi:hypothetical protein